MTHFAGSWFTTFGPMTLTQEGEHVSGTYRYGGAEGTITGRVEDDQLSFQFEDPAERGVGSFRLLRPGKFAGEYQSESAMRPYPWDGQRGFDGIWESSFGRVRLIQDADRVHGSYERMGPATIEGKIEDGRLVFSYQEPNARGKGWFQLDETDMSFQGQWSPEGSLLWSSWVGQRVLPAPGLTWLVVLEAHWQRSLADNEYAFGHMLREYFARLPNVKVRQRFFHDEASLQHWCRELLYLPEPAILMIASHGTPEGLSVHGKTINTHKVLSSLEYADNLRLLHFSSCLVMNDGGKSESHRPLVDQARFPVSGYTTSVDWGGSALIEFTYLDMILAKGLSPAHAAEQLPLLIGYAGDESIPGSPYGTAGFRFYAPRHPDEIMLAGSGR